jgi:hypothetical protein
VIGQYVWPNPNPIPVSYADEIASLKSWLRARADWIDQNLEDKGACGINQNPNVENPGYRFFPNPFNSRGYLQFQSIESGIIMVQIKDMLGIAIMKKQYSVFPANNKIELDTEKLQKGLYLIVITDTQNMVHTIRILKQ